MVRVLQAAVLALAALVCGGLAGARPASRQPPALPATGPLDLQPVDLRVSTLRRVDQGTADIGPLSTPGRELLRVELRQEDDFRSLYQIPASASSPFAGWFVRRAGGVWAVFPRSTYVGGRFGPVATVPPGTQYLLRPPDGLLPEGADNSSSPSPSVSTDMSTSLSTAIDTRIIEPATKAAERPTDTREILPGFDRTPRPEATPQASHAAIKRDSLMLLTSPKERDAIIARLISGAER